MAKRLSAIQHKELYQQVFGSDAGKLVLADICARFGVMRTSTPDDSDAKVRMHEGMRSVCLFILAQVDTDLNKYRELRQQHKVELTNDY